MKFTDKLLKDDRWILRKISEENVRQIDKWGIQSRSSFEWLTYTTEELGSLAKVISEHWYRNGLREKVVSEAIQVATLALKIAEMFEDKDCPDVE